MYSAAQTTPVLHSTDVVFRPGSVEYIRWTARGLPEDPRVDSVHVSFDQGKTWHQAELEDEIISILVAHPSVEEPHGNAVVAKTGVSNMLVKFVDSPENVVRPGGRLHCTS